MAILASKNKARRGPQATLPTNPILDIIRESWDGPNAYYCASEALFQLARHWSEWQSPRIGTFPLDYRDPGGPSPRLHKKTTSRITGDVKCQCGFFYCETEEDFGNEDYLYWDIFDAIELREDYKGEAAQDMIVHATEVMRRIYELTEGDG